ncbi:neuropeptide prohormone-4-like isoform X1 [Ruditapes philippinarum]|uniref:neuropeptide prohormone-4-like isoform X1 n=2 Tax=Ruditapes philippinarum TaxID=129788 RepID=UPI00295B1D76|nr:neuropeptide prohormone-4-like isoform X1 [Ruditapes philippinarum]
MDIIHKIFGKSVHICHESMRLFSRTQCIFIVWSVLSACTYGLSVDLSRLRDLRRPFILDKRPDATCTGNPCPAWKPFLCQSSQACIALDTVCDGHPDCPDHFDEDEELCNARKRPPVETIFKFLERNRKWMKQKLFSGADLELVAHSLAVSTNLDDLSMMVGLTPQSEKNLRNAFIGVLQNDMRALLKLGMPKGEWYDTSSLLTQIVDGGLEV